MKKLILFSTFLSLAGAAQVSAVPLNDEMIMSSSQQARGSAGYAFLKQAGQFASAAYEPLPEAQKVFQGYALKPIHGVTGLFNAKATIGYVAYKQEGAQGHIVIAIRGTDNFDDVCTDASALLVPLDERFSSSEVPSVQVHQGFHSTALSLLPHVQTALQEIRAEIGDDAYAHSQVEVIGHSLGGALANFSALALAKDTTLVPQGVSSVTTFGAPSFGNSTSVHLLNQVIPYNYHVYQPLDPVAQLKLDNFSYYTNRISVPTPDCSNAEALPPHVLKGYMNGLAEKFENKRPKQGWLGPVFRLMDDPQINPQIIQWMNQHGNYTVSYLSKPENWVSLSVAVWNGTSMGSVATYNGIINAASWVFSKVKFW